MKLIIFDLDQTLVDFLPVHDEVTRRLFRKFFNVDARLTDIDFAGKSLTENFGESARLKGVGADVFREKSPQLLPSYETGDSVRDVECGQQFGALTIAVATGFHSREKLSAAGPDYLLTNLKDYRKVLKAIGSL
jgi:phosphoglycolate phosphatase-like HAD superfamily hydrolase